MVIVIDVPLEFLFKVSHSLELPGTKELRFEYGEKALDDHIVESFWDILWVIPCSRSFVVDARQPCSKSPID